MSRDGRPVTIDRDLLFDVLHAIMDAGFRKGERYVYADELAYLLGKPFEFEEEDGEQVTVDGSQSWLEHYPWSHNDIGQALERWKNR